jgi:glycosyltransferase involved in cell wall biosynthesis
MSTSQRWPSVSVVVPTHNRPELLARAVRSILGQDYAGDVDCIVVFDKAVPTPVPVPTRPGRSIRVMANDRTPGLAGARNTGAIAATGELIGFLDDDDEWLPGKLRLQVELMRRTGSHMATCSIYVRRGNKRIVRAAQPVTTYRDLLRSRHMAVNPCTILVERRRFVADIGFVDEKIPGSYGEDYEWLLRVARTGDIPAVEQPLVGIDWHGASYFQRRWQTIAAAHQYILDKYPEFAGEPTGFSRIAGQISVALAAAGERRSARRWARRSLRTDPRQPRAYLGLLVSAGLLDANALLRLANAFGRGL